MHVQDGLVIEMTDSTTIGENPTDRSPAGKPLHLKPINI